MRPLDDPLPVDGALIQEQAKAPVSGLNESLLGTVFARKPREILCETYSLNSPISSALPKSPAEITQWFEKFLAEFAPVRS